MATLRDIAQHAGAHLSTASYVLNGGRGSTRVSKSTRDRVLESARELGYSAVRAAQQLRTGRSRVIGLLVGDLENPFFARMVSTCSDMLERRGYETIITERRRDEPADDHLLNTLLGRGVDGMLIWSETTTEARARLLRPDMENCVIIGYPIEGRDSVVVQLDRGVLAALDHLWDQGYRRIGFLGPRFAVARYGDPRHMLYCERAAVWQMPERVYTFDGTAFEIGASRERVQVLWKDVSPADRPDALLCFNDMTAIGALMGIRRAGGRVPDDIAIVGCDDLPIASQMDVPLSSICYPIKEIVAEAVRLLIERIDAPSEAAIAAGEAGASEGLPASRVVWVRPEFLVRESSLRPA